MINFYLKNIRFLVNMALLLFTLLLLGYAAKLIYHMIYPFVIGTIISLLVEPIIIRFQKSSVSRIYVVLMVVIVIVLFSLLILGTVISGLTNEINALIKEYPFTAESFQNNQRLLLDKISSYQDIVPIEVINSIKEYSSKISQYLIEATSMTIKTAFSIVTSIPDKILVFVIIIMYVFFLSKDLPYFKDKLLNLIPKALLDKTKLIISDARLGLLGYIKAQVIIAVITSVVIFSGLLIIGSKFVLTISTMCLFASFVPFLGVNIILIPWTLYSAVFFPRQFTVELLIIIVIVTVTRHIIEPKILGDNLGIKPIGILVASFIGLQLLGFWGLVLGPIGLIILNSMLKSGLLKSILFDN